jgi:hypothetical protein
VAPADGASRHTERILGDSLHLHVEYSAKRDEWVRCGIDLLAKGNDKAGMVVAEKAQPWDLCVNHFCADSGQGQVPRFCT